MVMNEETIFYKIDNKKRKKALSKSATKRVKTASIAMKIFYALSVLLKVAAVILGILNIAYAFMIKEWVYLLFLGLTVVVPMCFAMIFWSFYSAYLTADFRCKSNEIVAIKDKEIVYTFHDNRAGINDSLFAYTFAYDQIDRIEYDEETTILTIYGKILVCFFENKEFQKETYVEKETLFDAYDISLHQYLNERCKK